MVFYANIFIYYISLLYCLYILLTKNTIPPKIAFLWLYLQLSQNVLLYCLDLTFIKMFLSIQKGRSLMYEIQS